MRSIIFLVVMAGICIASYFAFTVVENSQKKALQIQNADLVQQVDRLNLTIKTNKELSEAKLTEIRKALVVVFPDNKEAIERSFNPPATQPTTSPATSTAPATQKVPVENAK